MTLRQRAEEVLLMYRYLRLKLRCSRYHALRMAWSFSQSESFMAHLRRMREEMQA